MKARNRFCFIISVVVLATILLLKGTATPITKAQSGNAIALTKHIIADHLDSAQSVYATDIDSDGDQDIFGAASGAGSITWWEQNSSFELYLPIVLKPLEAPVLDDISNPDGDGNYTVTWSSVHGAEYYSLQEDDEPSFASPTVVYSGTGTSKSISGRDVGTYYYRVRDSNSAGTSDWSNVKSVVVTVPLPPCSVTCGADASRWWVNITCESGSTSSTTSSYQYYDSTRGWVTHYEIDRTYNDSGNTYHITAEYWQVYTGVIEGRVTVDVTGGAFGENTQHCQNY